MPTQSTEYLSCNRLFCGTLPAPVILCIPIEIVEPHMCPVGGSEEPVNELTEYSFIYATLEQESERKGFCATSMWRYVFSYDDGQLIEGATLTGDIINGVVCESCLTAWIKDIVGTEPYIRTDENNHQFLQTPHGCSYQINTIEKLAPSHGTFVANGASAVVVANTAITAGSVVVPCLKTIGGAPTLTPRVSAITAGVGFSVVSNAGDTSTYNYIILETNP